MLVCMWSFGPLDMRGLPGWFVSWALTSYRGMSLTSLGELDTRYFQDEKTLKGFMVHIATGL